MHEYAQLDYLWLILAVFVIANLLVHVYIGIHMTSLAE